MTVARINNPSVIIFVTNIKIIRAKNSRVIGWVKDEIIFIIEMVDMVPIIFYFGLKLNYNCKKKIIKLFQLVYIEKILAKFYLSQVNISNTLMKENPLELNIKKATFTE